MQGFKNLCEKVGKLRAIIFLILTTLFIFVGVIVLISIFSPSNDVPFWVECCILIFFAAIWVIYFYHLYFVCYEKEQLRLTEQADTPEDTKQVKIQTAEDIVHSCWKTLLNKKTELNKLKGKVIKTSNPFLIRRYLKKKADFEYISLKLECYSNYLYAQEIDVADCFKYDSIPFRSSEDFHAPPVFFSSEDLRMDEEYIKEYKSLMRKEKYDSNKEVQEEMNHEKEQNNISN